MPDLPQLARPLCARTLLARAAELYDRPDRVLQTSAVGAARGGFAFGAAWMGRALAVLRDQTFTEEMEPTVTGRNYHWLGAIKYGLATGAALACLVIVIGLNAVWLAPLALLVFYAVEAQMVFLFPLALDGSQRPFRDARLWTRRAGGTLAVMRVVLPVACVMLGGGFVGRGFVRSWCLGCLAICIWYEMLRRSASPSRPRFFPLTFGSFGTLSVRREAVELGLARPVRILYASDLHLGHWWTTGVAKQLQEAAESTNPNVILLGGDLVDDRTALPQLAACVAALARSAPVHAIPGNHDVRPGVARVREAVVSAGGHWLPDRPVQGALRIDGTVDPSAAGGPRLLCAHFPSVFPAAVAAGYRLVLAGHLHGGQCVLATRRGRLYPAVWLHRWHGLRFAERGATLLVSRGAADTFPFRFNCPREVLLCAIS